MSKLGLRCTFLVAFFASANVLWAQQGRRAAASDSALTDLPIVVEKDAPGASPDYCGLYCFYANAKWYGIDIDLSKLINVRYMTGEFGSSVQDLLVCSRDFGFRAQSYGTLNLLDLWLMERPVLALVKNTLDGRVYNHWVIVIGVAYSHVTLLDPSAFDASTGLTTLPMSEFLSVWSGIGCVIIPEQGDTIRYHIERCVTVALTVFVLFGLTLGYSSFRSLLPNRLKLASVPIFSIACAILYHYCSPIGFIANARQVAILTTPPRTEIGYTKMETWIADAQLRGSCYLIDVRYPTAFNSAHIPGAVNIPVTSSDLKFLNSLRHVSRDTPIILYCQSAECLWASACAQRRLFDEFRQVTVLEGGMRAYAAIKIHDRDVVRRKSGS